MSHFYGEIWGDRSGCASHGGSAASGMTAHIRSWDVGVYLNCYVNEQGHDIIQIWRTEGSLNPTKRQRIAELVYERPTGTPPRS